MKLFKNHFGVIFPLVVLLFAIQFSLLIKQVVSAYERSMGRDYNIIIVSSKDINESDIRPIINTFKSINTLDTAPVINRLKGDVSAPNLSILQNSLPKFYSIKLNNFPSSSYLKKLKAVLEKLNGVIKVETFSNTHDRIYKILLVSKFISYTFTLFSVIMGLMLVFKQMKIWLYEHKERIEIMNLFGAPFWIKSGVLYKIAIIDSLIASIIVAISMISFPELNIVKTSLKAIGIAIEQNEFFGNFAILFIVAIIIGILSATIVMIKTKE